MELTRTTKPESRCKPGWAVICWMGVILLVLSLAACNAAPAGDPARTGSGEPNSPGPVEAQAPGSAGEATAPGKAEPIPTAAPSNNQAEAAPPESPEQIQANWETGPHANTYVLDNTGKNDTCARCHAPVNWIPSMDDMPESCYACKFEVDPPPPVILEEEWTHVECKICHVTKKKQVQPEISWLEIAQIEQYAAVASATELCLKCHVPVEVPGHIGASNAGAHADMACSACHDAHSMAASCGEAGCHAALEAPDAVIPGHDADHANVTCSACHDAGELEVGPDAAGVWVTYHPSPAETSAEKVAYTSHKTVREAPCQRCHYAENPWELSLVEVSQPGD